MKKYHVSKNWNGRDLESLTTFLGDYNEAIEQFCERWPECTEAADLHVTYVFLYDSVQLAEQHAATFGGDILEINCEHIDLVIDPYEGFCCVKNSIDSEYIKKYAQK